MQQQSYQLSVTTQGPSYPPSEVMDGDGNFIVIGRINRDDGQGGTVADWGRALVGADSALPAFGQNLPYRIVRELPPALSAADRALVLHTLPLPLPCSNYPVVFAPEQCPDAHRIEQPSHAFHAVPIPDLRAQDGRKLRAPVTLGQWMEAQGRLDVALSADARSASFRFAFTGLLPHSMYTVMCLRQHDANPAAPTRPGPLGVPNVFVTDAEGCARYFAELPDPFPAPDRPGANRLINVVVLWMSYQMNYGGAIGRFGLGGDIHAQLKLQGPSFGEFITYP